MRNACDKAAAGLAAAARRVEALSDEDLEEASLELLRASQAAAAARASAAAAGAGAAAAAVGEAAEELVALEAALNRTHAMLVRGRGMCVFRLRVCFVLVQVRTGGTTGGQNGASGAGHGSRWARASCTHVRCASGPTIWPKSFG